MGWLGAGWGPALFLPVRADRKRKGIAVLSDVNLRAYREARREGYPIATALYSVRPPVVALESEPYADAFDAGTFTWHGVTFSYRVEWDNDCLCYESGSEVDPEEARGYEHLSVGVCRGDEWTDEASWLGSVCGDERTPVRRRMFERHIAEVCRDLAYEEMRRDIPSGQLIIEGAV
jgi:hypothetical protein